MAIITRWHMPPESWWAYCRARRSGSEMPTSFSISMVRAHPSAREAPWCSSNSRAICRPTGRTGSAPFAGALEDHRDPRATDGRICSSDSASRSVPSNRAAPRTMRPGPPDEAEQRERHHRLPPSRTRPPGPGSRRHVERSAVHRFHESVLRLEVDGEVADFEQVLHGIPRIRGSGKLRRPSPTRLKASTVSMMARPGRARATTRRTPRNRRAPLSSCRPWRHPSRPSPAHHGAVRLRQPCLERPDGPRRACRASTRA